MNTYVIYWILKKVKSNYGLKKPIKKNMKAF